MHAKRKRNFQRTRQLVNPFSNKDSKLNKFVETRSKNFHAYITCISNKSSTKEQKIPPIQAVKTTLTEQIVATD